MVSMSSAAPASFRICRVAAIISGPMPSPWATVIGVGVAIDAKLPRITCEAIRRPGLSARASHGNQHQTEQSCAAQNEASRLRSFIRVERHGYSARKTGRKGKKTLGLYKRIFIEHRNLRPAAGA